VDGVLTWRRLTEPDLPLLRRWLDQPHVARWWNHETTPEAVARDFGPATRGEEPAEDLVVLLDGVPVGLVQRYRYGEYPEYLAELAPVLEVDPEAVGIDYLVGELALVGRGLGTRIVRAIVEATWTDHPAAPAVVVPVSAANHASRRVLEKAGLRRVAEGELTPDNPVDDRDHVVHRADRPGHRPPECSR
jgi:aminoglycoside 6'-N-acetyltransferase